MINSFLKNPHLLRYPPPALAEPAPAKAGGVHQRTPHSGRRGKALHLGVFQETVNAIVIIIVLSISSHRLEAKTQDILQKSPRQLFSHKIHQSILLKNNISCMSCHVFNVKTATKKSEKAKDFSAKLLSDVGRSSCHLCHNNPQSKAQLNAPTRCNLCHALTPKIKPITHTPDWRFLHGASARANSQSCTSCHRTHECQTCHSPSPAQIPFRRMHVDNFEYNHSILARVNPQKCSTCHSPNYCVRCHEGRH